MTIDVHLHRISAEDKADQAKLDVVFIHGLGGHWEETWRAKKGDATWPGLLATAQPELNVWSLEYPAVPGHWRAVIAEAQVGTEGLAAQISQCLRDKGLAKSNGRPCVFVCHSLGGIVAKRLLLHAHEHTAEFAIDHMRVLGVIFLGTPHRGSAMADWLKTAEGAKEILGSVAAKAVEYVDALAGTSEWVSTLIDRASGAFFATSQLIEELEEGNVELQRLNGRFNTYWQQRFSDEETRLRVRICAENVKLDLIDRFVVDHDSANPDLHLAPGGPAVPVLMLPYNHMQICKVADLDSEVNGYLRGLLQECLDEPEGIDLKLPPHRYQAMSAIGRLIASNSDSKAALVEVLQLQPHCAPRDVRDRLMGQADMQASAKTVTVLAACLRKHGTRPPLDVADKIVSWAMVAGLVPDACRGTPNKIVSFMAPGNRVARGTDVDAAMMETALAKALRRIPRLPTSAGDSGMDFSPHLIESGEVTARDIDPGRLLHYLERRVLSDVELGESKPLRVALSQAADADAKALSSWDRGDLEARVHGLSLDGRGIGLDDRSRGNFMENPTFDDALRGSPLKQVLFVIGAAETCPEEADLSQFRAALRQYLKDRLKVSAA